MSDKLILTIDEHLRKQIDRIREELGGVDYGADEGAAREAIKQTYERLENPGGMLTILKSENVHVIKEENGKLICASGKIFGGNLSVEFQNGEALKYYDIGDCFSSKIDAEAEIEFRGYAIKPVPKPQED